MVHEAEGVGDLDRLIENAARIAAQVEHITERVTAGCLIDRKQRGFGRIARIAAENVEIDDADPVLDLPFDRVDVDLFAHAGSLDTER